jgi:hypothetical protein
VIPARSHRSESKVRTRWPEATPLFVKPQTERLLRDLVRARFGPA